MLVRARNSLKQWFRGRGSAVAAPTLQQMLEVARNELQTAQGFFQNVSDPELVDFAVQSLHLAEKRYDYLLKSIRDQQLHS